MKLMLLAVTAALSLAMIDCGGWSKQDTILEAAYLMTASADETQTQWTTRHCTETNPVIGACGMDRVGPWFFLTDIAHIGVSLILPPSLRAVWQGLTVGSEAATVWKNYGDGISFWP